MHVCGDYAKRVTEITNVPDGLRVVDVLIKQWFFKQ
jgi:hypothetical protein